MSVADIKYLEASELYRWMQQGYTTTFHEEFQVVDVRGQDYIGGHIVGGWHIPYKELSHDSAAMDSLKKRLMGAAGNINVVFHCAQSQQRGPSAALKLLRSLDADEKKRITVWVLRGGFNHWQDVYGEDDTVTEDYAPDLWTW